MKGAEGAAKKIQGKKFSKVFDSPNGGDRRGCQFQQNIVKLKLLVGKLINSILY